MSRKATIAAPILAMWAAFFMAAPLIATPGLALRHFARLALVAALLAAGGLPALPALAQVSCVTPEDAARHLRLQYDEHLAATAVTSAGWLVQLFVSDSGTWTQMLYEPNTGCAGAALSGAGWTKESGGMGAPA